MPKNTSGEVLLLPADFATVAYLLQRLIFSEGDEIEITFRITKKDLNLWMDQSESYIARKELTDANTPVRTLPE